MIVVTDDFGAEFALLHGKNSVVSVSITNTSIYREKEAEHLSAEVEWILYISKVGSLTWLGYKTEKTARKAYHKFLKELQLFNGGPRIP